MVEIPPFENADDWGMVYHCFNINVFFLWSTFFSFLKDNIFSSAKFVRNRGVQILGLFLLLATLSSLFLLLASEILWIGSCFPAFLPLGFPSDCVGFFHGTNGDVSANRFAEMLLDTTLVLHWLLRLAWTPTFCWFTCLVWYWNTQLLCFMPECV